MFANVCWRLQPTCLCLRRQLHVLPFLDDSACDMNSTATSSLTLCPSGLRGWTQVPLARAAWAQIPQVSFYKSYISLLHGFQSEPNISHYPQHKCAMNTIYLFSRMRDMRDAIVRLHALKSLVRSDSFTKHVGMKFCKHCLSQALWRQYIQHVFLQRNKFWRKETDHNNTFILAKEPPVGFEPTTSRLLSGCSAN